MQSKRDTDFDARDGGVREKPDENGDDVLGACVTCMGRHRRGRREHTLRSSSRTSSPTPWSSKSTRDASITSLMIW